MAGEESPSGGRAVVFGGGGLVGTAWLFGLIAGLRDAGVDLANADLVIGTSAGSIAGAMLTSGADLSGYGDLFPEPEPEPASAPTDPARPPLPTGSITEMFAMFTDGRLDPVVGRRQVGEFALNAPTMDERAHLDTIGALVPVRAWPTTRLLITSVDTATGEREVWDAARGAALLTAIGASTSVPGVFPPVTINGGRYMDGGVWSVTNADLAAGADVLLVAEPLAHLVPRETLRRELAAVGAATVVTVSPDEPAIAAFGPDLLSPAGWRPAYRAGVRQGTDTAANLRTAWRPASTPRATPA